MNDTERLTDFITRLIAELMPHPDQVVVDVSRDRKGYKAVITVAKEDFKYLIGRAGFNISAIRYIVKMWANLRSMGFVGVVLNDRNNSPANDFNINDIFSTPGEVQFKNH